MSHRVVIEVVQSLSDAFGRNLSHLQYGKFRYVSFRRLNHLSAIMPKVGTRAVLGNDLGCASSTMLETDQSPTFSH
jgi:hypothetical protein